MKINPEGYTGIKINTAIFLLIIAVVTATALVYDWAWWALALVDGFLVWRIIFFIYFFREPNRKVVRDQELVYMKYCQHWLFCLTFHPGRCIIILK